jgi:hypothetical protein
MDMGTLQASLKAIECVCTNKKAHVATGKKASHKKGRSQAAQYRSQDAGSQKSPFLRSLVSYARIMGAQILRTLTRIAACTRKAVH